MLSNASTGGLSTEIVTARSAELVLTNDLSTETSTARSAELVLTNDLSTEALYFISVLDPNKVKEDWIINLQNSQNKDGTFGKINKSWPKKNQEIMKAHHAALALLTLHNFYNGIIETNY